MNEKVVLNQDVKMKKKQAVQSAFFIGQKKREDGPSRTFPTSPAWPEKEVQTLKEVKKSSHRHYKLEHKEAKRSHKMAATRTERLINTQILE